MAHEIYEKMFYSYLKPAWHGIQEPSEIPMSAEAILDSEAFHGGFNIALRPVILKLNGVDVETGDFGIVREASTFDRNEIVFGYCTDRFHPLQPREICKTFDKSVQQNAETMAFLKEGREMFISWQMPSSEIVAGDEVEFYGIIRCGFDTLKGARLFTSTFRPVCANTITLAQNWAKRNTDGNGRGEIWKGKAVNKNLLRDLGYWMAHVQGNALKEVDLVSSFFKKCAKTPIKNDVQAHRLLYQAYPPVDSVSKYFPKELASAREEKTQEVNQKASEIRDGVYALFAGAGKQITPDYWGMLNATSEYFCHYQPSKRPVAESIMFGGRQANIMQMVEVLQDNA